MGDGVSRRHRADDRGGPPDAGLRDARDGPRRLVPVAQARQHAARAACSRSTSCWPGAERFLVEFLRRNDAVAAGLTLAQFVALAMMVGGGVWLACCAARGVPVAAPRALLEQPSIAPVTQARSQSSAACWAAASCCTERWSPPGDDVEPRGRMAQPGGERARARPPAPARRPRRAGSARASSAASAASSGCAASSASSAATSAATSELAVAAARARAAARAPGRSRRPRPRRRRGAATSAR